MKQLSGMTGFARVSGTEGDESWTWEARSVNGKGLDIRMRMPSEFSAIDAPIRKAFGAVFSRGNIQLSLTLQSGTGGKSYHINEGLIDKLESFALDRGGVPELGQILMVQGVVSEQSGTRSEEAQISFETALLESAKDLAVSLKNARDNEGAALAPFLMGAIDQIASLCNEAESAAASQPKALKEVLSAKLSALLSESIPEDRLAQEAAFLAIKADVKEELDRLTAHCDQARKLMAKGSPVGRKLGFLAQEFNREVNTLCAKSADIQLTRIGLDLKSVVEQFREQAANVE